MPQIMQAAQLHPVVPMTRMGFPDDLISKYNQAEPAFTRVEGGEVRNFELVEHIVRSSGIREFVVVDPEGNTLGEFTQVGCNEAFMAACRFVDALGKPWKASNGPVFFDPATSRCWRPHVLVHANGHEDVTGA